MCLVIDGVQRSDDGLYECQVNQNDAAPERQANAAPALLRLRLRLPRRILYRTKFTKIVHFDPVPTREILRLADPEPALQHCFIPCIYFFIFSKFVHASIVLGKNVAFY
jgi:hypothetical protein